MLNVMFNAKSVAVIGASETKGKIGNDLMISLLNYYHGDIVPVNPKGGEVMGIQPTHPSRIMDMLILLL